jgi:type IV pilus assembly protein PilQ
MRAPIAVLVLALLASPMRLDAGGGNRLTDISVQEREKFTLIEVANTGVPTFSVFKLEDPPRLFVDLANTQVAFDKNVEVYNGVINDVGTLQFASHATPTSRVIVNLRRDALYTVDTTGTTLRIVVDGSARQAQAPDAAALKALEDKESALKARVQEYEAQNAELDATIQARRHELATLQSQGSESLRALRASTDLEETRKAKVAESRKTEEELRRAAERAVQEEKDRLSALKASVQAEEERRAAVEAARKKEEEKQRFVASQRAEEEKLLDAMRTARAEQEHNLAEIEAKTAQVDAMRREISEASDAEKAKLEKERTALARELEGLKKERTAQADTLEKAKRSLTSFQEKNQSSLARYEKDAKALQERVSQTSERLATLEANVAERNRQREQLEDQVGGLESRKAQLAAELTGIQKSLASGKSTLAESEARAQAKEREVARLEAELKGLDEQRRRNEGRQEEAQKTLASLTVKLTEVRGQLAHEESRLKEVVEVRKLEEERIRELQKETGELTKAAPLKAELDRTRDELARTRADYEAKVADLQRAGGSQKVAAEKQAKAAQAAMDEARLAYKQEVAASRAEIERTRAAYEAKLAELQSATGGQRARVEQELKAARDEADQARTTYETELTTLRDELGRTRAAYEAKLAEVEKTKGGERTRAEQDLKSARSAADEARALYEKEVAGLRDELGRTRAAYEAKLAEVERSDGADRAALQRELTSARAAMDEARGRYENELASTRAELERTRAAYQAQGDEVGQLKARLTELRDELARREQALASAQKGQKGTAGEVAAERAKVAELRAQIDQLTKRADAEVADLRQELTTREADYRQKLAARDTDAAGLKDEIERLRLRLADSEKTYEDGLGAREAGAAALQSEISTLKAQLADASKARDDARARLGSTDARLAEAVAEVQRLKQSSAEQSTEVGRLQSEIDRTRFLLTAQKGLQGQEQRNLEQLKGRIAELETSAKAEKKAKAAGYEQRLEDNQAALAALRSEKGEAEKNLARLASSREEDRKRLADLEKQLGANRDELAKVTRALKEREARLAEREARDQELAADGRVAVEQATRLAATADELKGTLKAKEAELARLSGEVQQLNEAREADRQALEAARASREAELARLSGEVQQLSEAREADARALEAARASREAELARLSGEVQQLNKAREADARALEEARTRLVASMKARDEAKSGAGRVADVRFDGDGADARVELTLDGDPSYRVTDTPEGRKVLVLTGATLDRARERLLDVTSYRGPVASVASFNDRSTKGQVRVVVQTNGKVDDRIEKQGDRLVWTFTPRSGGAVRQAFPTTVAADAAAASPAGGSAAGGLSLPGSSSDFSGAGVLNPYPFKKRKKYSGKRINLTIKDADIQDVISFLAREGGVNIVANDEVKGTVSFHLENIPWDLAFDMILKAKGLDYVKEGEVYRVAPLEAIQKEYDILIEKKKKAAALKSLVVRLVTVNYASAVDLVKRVKSLLSEKGSVEVDERTNTIILKDIEEHVIAIEDLVRRLDTQTPQVLIEARIVEATDNFTRDVGVQWGGHLGFGQEYGNQTGLVFPNVIGLSGGSDSANSPSGGVMATTPGFAVNLPAATGAGSGGAMGLTLGSIGGAANLNLRLSAAEENGNIKIVSAPKVSTLDNTAATIQQGVSIPVSVVSAQGVNTQFFNALLKLEVLPHVTQDGNISLKIDIAKNEPDFAQTGASGNPSIRKKEAHTELLVKDGDTTVIGGIYTRNTSDGYKKVPFFADLPVLGPMFRNHKVTDQRSELLIFITPRIINRAASEVRTD